MIIHHAEAARATNLQRFTHWLEDALAHHGKPDIFNTNQCLQFVYLR